MSKSLGNFFTIREVCSQYYPLALRLFLLSSFYRSGLNFSPRGLEEVWLPGLIYMCTKLLQKILKPEK